MNSPRLLAGLALVAFVYLVLTLTTVFTRAPWCDEGWFGNPAYNLAFKGFMGTTVLDPASSTWKSVNLTGIDRHTYWVMPLNLLANAAGFRIFGFGIYSMRLLSVFWGLVALAAWGAILWKLAAPRPLIVLGVGLIAVDYHFLMQASDGRMDAMTVALGWSSIAAYLLLRERRFLVAIGFSCTLASMAVFTHPNGAILAILLVITALYFDRAQIRARAIAIAALPCFAIAAAWGIYIAQAPADFQAQFLGNAAGRGPTITTPIAALSLEITHRYMDSYGLAAWSSITGRLNVIPLFMFLAAVAVCLFVPAIRRHPGYRLLVIWTVVVMFFLTELEGLKTHFYLIYLTPLYSLLLAVALSWMWTRLARWRWLLTAAILLFVALQALRTTSSAWHNRRQLSYDPAVEYLRTHTDPKTFTMGGAGLAFGLGPDWNLLDDTHLGYDSGKRPRLVVIDPTWDDAILMMQSNAPAIHSYLTRLLETEYREVYNHAGYRVLARLKAQEPVHD